MESRLLWLELKLVLFLDDHVLGGARALQDRQQLAGCLRSLPFGTLVRFIFLDRKVLLYQLLKLVLIQQA